VSVEARISLLKEVITWTKTLKNVTQNWLRLSIIWSWIWVGGWNLLRKRRWKMGRQIIKQPNGKLAVWSSIVDDFIYINCTRDELVEFMTEEAKDKIAAEVDEVLEKLERNEKPYFQFTMTFTEAVDLIEACHGERHAVGVLQQIQEVEK
jgi:hypothetical protein